MVLPAGQSRGGVALEQRQRGVGLYPRNRRYLFSSCFRLVFVFLPCLYRDGLNMVSGRIERDGRLEGVGRGFGQVG